MQLFFRPAGGLDPQIYLSQRYGDALVILSTIAYRSYIDAHWQPSYSNTATTGATSLHEEQ
jgi:hypothetical protein